VDQIGRLAGGAAVLPQRANGLLISAYGRAPARLGGIGRPARKAIGRTPRSGRQGTGGGALQRRRPFRSPCIMWPWAKSANFFPTAKAAARQVGRANPALTHRPAAGPRRPEFAFCRRSGRPVIVHREPSTFTRLWARPTSWLLDLFRIALRTPGKRVFPFCVAYYRGELGKKAVLLENPPDCPSMARTPRAHALCVSRASPRPAPTGWVKSWKSIHASSP